MGAYENPNSKTHSSRMTAIAKQQQSFLTDMISGIGQTAANIINSAQTRQTDTITASQNFNNKRELKLLKLKNEAAINISKSGIGNDSFFNMANENIDRKDMFTTFLENASDPDQRQRASKALEGIDRNQRAVTQYINYYKDWEATYGKELNQRDRNNAGGVFTGNPNGTEFEKETYKNYLLKNALVGGALNKDGSKLMEPVAFYQNDEGQIMGKLDGYDDFNILELIATPPVEILDFKQDKTIGLNKKWKEAGYMKDGNIKDEYLNYADPSIGEGEKFTNPKGVKMITQQIPIQPAAQQAWLKTMDTTLAGILASTDDQTSFRNLQASYFSIAGEFDQNLDGSVSEVEAREYGIDGKEYTDLFGDDGKLQALNPLGFKDGNYNLDAVSEANFRKVYLTTGYQDYFGTGYVEKKSFDPDQGGTGTSKEQNYEAIYDETLSTIKSDIETKDFSNLVGGRTNGKTIAVTDTNDIGDGIVKVGFGRKDKSGNYTDGRTFNLNNSKDLRELAKIYATKNFKLSSTGKQSINSLTLNIEKELKAYMDEAKKNKESEVPLPKGLPGLLPSGGDFNEYKLPKNA